LLAGLADGLALESCATHRYAISPDDSGPPLLAPGSEREFSGVRAIVSTAADGLQPAPSTFSVLFADY